MVKVKHFFQEKLSGGPRVWKHWQRGTRVWKSLKKLGTAAIDTVKTFSWSMLYRNGIGHCGTATATTAHSLAVPVPSLAEGGQH